MCRREWSVWVGPARASVAAVSGDAVVLDGCVRSVADVYAVGQVVVDDVVFDVGAAVPEPDTGVIARDHVVVDRRACNDDLDCGIVASRDPVTCNLAASLEQVDAAVHIGNDVVGDAWPG